MADVVKPWVLVSGDFTPLGGMDYANYALARGLASADRTVHLVTHRAWQDLSARQNVVVHDVPRPMGKHLLGAASLARRGRHVARRLVDSGCRVLVNGGNCSWRDLNWVHYVHAAYTPAAGASLFNRAKTQFHHRQAVAAERAIVPKARVVICNSERTRRDVVERLGVDESRARVVYYGSDPTRFAPVTSEERDEARASLGWSSDRPVVVFVGALGDRRKGFDTIFGAWRLLAGDRDWDCDLAVAGTGAELESWRRRAADAGMSDRIHFLGFRNDVPAILAACDAMVHPARYEAYGLGVQEAICRGIPALVSEHAGVAERFTPELRALLVDDVENPASLADRLRVWREGLERFRDAVAPLSERMRSHTWDEMARQIMTTAEAAE